jgi:hypothetical protein
MGLKPYGAPEVFYYSAYRPYRGGEGGEAPKAKFVHRDISATLDQKTGSAELLHTRNRAWVFLRTGLLDETAVRRYIREFLFELAATVGRKHGLPAAEEFNHVGPVKGVPEHALEKARPRN